MRQLGVGVAAAWLALLGTPALAQEQPEQVTLEQADVGGYPNVTVNLTISADTPALEAGAFSLTENGIPRDLQVEKLPGDTLEVVLVIDRSGSMRGAPMDATRAALREFVAKLPSTVAYTLVAFGDVAEVIAGPGADAAAVISAVDALIPRGETALYDGVLTGLAQFSTSRRTLVVMSDGADTVSASSLEAATEAVRGSSASLYAIALESPEGNLPPLGILAEAGGGRTVAVSDPAGLATVYQGFASALVNQYRLTYSSQAHGLATITVTVATGAIARQATRDIQLPPTPPVVSSPPEQTPVVDPQVLPALRPGIEQAIPKFGSSWASRVGLSLLGAALGLFAFVFLVRPTPRVRLSAATQGGPISGSGALSTSALRMTEFADRILRRDRHGSLSRLLEKSGSLTRPAELVAFVGLITLATAAIGLLAIGTVGGLIGSVLPAFATILYLRQRAQRRADRFGEQLEGTLQLISGGLRAGYGLLQAIDAVAKEAPSPTGDEFRRLVAETRLGRDLHDSLRGIADRVGGEDFEWVLQAIDINREIGGDLAEVLDLVSDTIRERSRLRRQVKALTAEGRVSAYILVSLPFVLALLISLLRPSYMTELFQTMPGRVMVGTGIVLITAGSVWMRRIIKLEY